MSVVVAAAIATTVSTTSAGRRRRLPTTRRHMSKARPRISYLQFDGEQRAQPPARATRQPGLVDEGPVAHRDQPVRGGRDPLVVGDNDEREPGACRSSKSRSTSKVAALSRLPVGSSASTTSGSLARARAMATRWR